MATSQRDVRNRISAVKNIQKITRAMEMVAAARLRRAEQRIEALRPYAGRDPPDDPPGGRGRRQRPAPADPRRARGGQPGRAAAVAGDRGLAGAFNSNIVRAGVAAGREHDRRGPHARVLRLRPPAGVVARPSAASSLAESFTGFTDRPAYADARRIADRLMAAYVDDEVDQVEIFYNGYISPISQVGAPRDAAAAPAGDDPARRATRTRTATRIGRSSARTGARWSSTSPTPRRSSARLVPDYVEISIYRALLESTASEHGARMTAMRNASDNAGELIEDLTLEMNRARQAEITQEIMEVVAGAEGLSG